MLEATTYKETEDQGRAAIKHPHLIHAKTSDIIPPSKVYGNIPIVDQRPFE